MTSCTRCPRLRRVISRTRSLKRARVLAVHAAFPRGPIWVCRCFSAELDMRGNFDEGLVVRVSAFVVVQVHPYRLAAGFDGINPAWQYTSMLSTPKVIL
jgi:hypothetical protein